MKLFRSFYPKLALTAVIAGSDFATRLERAIERSQTKMIEAKVEEDFAEFESLTSSLIALGPMATLSGSQLALNKPIGDRGETRRLDEIELRKSP